MNERQETIRSFIAIQLTDEARGGLAQLQGELKNILPPNTVRWTSPKNIHLTLHFLGDVDKNQLETISRTVHELSHRHTALILDLVNLGCFPNTRRPRIVWVGLSGEIDALAHIQQELGKALQAAIGFQPESRKYSPHLTIGRVKKGVPQQQLHELGRALENEISRVGRLSSLPVDFIHFIRSDLKPAGPIHTTLSKAHLAGAS